MRSVLSEESNIDRLRNFLRQKSDEVYSEQTPGVKRRVDRIGARIQRFKKRYDNVKRERAPIGREVVRRHLIGGATNLADVLDGKHAVRPSHPKPREQRKKVSRKSRVVR